MSVPLFAVESVPTLSLLCLYPFLVLLVGFILWVLHFNKRKQGINLPALLITAYILIIGSSAVGYAVNHEYFEPVIFTAQNYWNNRSKSGLIASVSLGFPVAICCAIADFIAVKRGDFDEFE